MSQRLLARMIGVAPGTIQNYEHSRAPMTTRRIMQLARALQCEPADLISPSEAPPSSMQMPAAAEILSLWNYVPISPGFYGRNANARSTVQIDSASRMAFGLTTNAPHLIWDNWFRRIHRDDLDRVKRELEHLDRFGVFAMQYRLIGLDGVERSIVDCGRHTLLDGQKKSMRLQGMVLDVTQMRRSKASEQAIARIIAAMKRRF